MHCRLFVYKREHSVSARKRLRKIARQRRQGYYRSETAGYYDYSYNALSYIGFAVYHQSRGGRYCRQRNQRYESFRNHLRKSDFLFQP